MKKMKKWLEQFVRKYIWIPNVCVINTYATTEDGTELHAKAVCVVKAKRMLKPHEADHLNQAGDRCAPYGRNGKRWFL